MIRRYVDISHNRAPYKAWPMLSGFGAEDVAASLVDVRDGIRYLKPEVAAAVINIIKPMETIFLSDTAVQLDTTQSGQRETADAWIQRQLAAGYTIVIGSPAGIPALVAPTDVVRTLQAVKGVRGLQGIAGANTLALTAVLVEGEHAAAEKASMNLVTIGLIAGAALVAVALFAKKKRHAVANRRGLRRSSKRSYRRAKGRYELAPSKRRRRRRTTRRRRK